MKHRSWQRICSSLPLGVLLLFSACNKAPAPPPIPKQESPKPAKGELVLAGRVTDAAHLLKPKEIASLNTYLESFEARSRHQMVIVTVPTLNGADIGTYTRDLAARSGIGRKDANDGIVLLLAPKEKKVRIFVGQGLDDLLTHDYCAKVVEAMSPLLQKEQYYDGLMIGVTGLGRMARRV